jgi:hypothetical protein
MNPIPEFQDSDIDLSGILNQVVVFALTPSEAWLTTAQLALFEQRNIMDETFIAWAVAINGLHIAVDRYSDPERSAKNALSVKALRAPIERRHELMVIRRYIGAAETTEIHKMALSHLTTWGFVEYYGKLEELVFTLFRCLLNDHPLEIIDKKRERALLDLYNARLKDPQSEEAWRTAWKDRLESWQRKKLYGGLAGLLLDFIRRAKLKAPPQAELEVESWGRTLKLLSEVRNSLVHGALTASPRLAQLVDEAGRANAGLTFKPGDQLQMSVEDLWKIELFGTQLTGALQIAIGNRACEGPHEIRTLGVTMA